jgi:hypothetical protein
MAPLERVIKLDFDRAKVNWRLVAKRILFADHLLRLRPEYVVIHRTNHGYHMRLIIRKRLKPEHVIALQACFGSDPKREILNLERLMHGKFANVLHNNTERKLIFDGTWENFMKWCGYAKRV